MAALPDELQVSLPDPAEVARERTRAPSVAATTAASLAQAGSSDLGKGTG